MGQTSSQRKAEADVGGRSVGLEWAGAGERRWGEGEDEEEEEDTQNKYNRDNRETQTVCLRPLSINLTCPY